MLRALDTPSPDRQRGARLSGALALVTAAVLFSTGGAAIKLSSLDVPALVAGRSALAAVSFLLFLPARHRRCTASALLTALPYAATMVLFVTATRLTTAANAILLQSTAPLYLILLAPWLLAERLARGELAVLACMLGGILLVAADPTHPSGAAAPAAGNAAAAAAGLTWALAVIGFRHLATGSTATIPGAALIAGNTIATALTLPFALPLPALPAREIAIVAWLGAVQIALGYTCLAVGVRSASAMTATLILLLEPVLNPLWVYCLHGERPGPLATLGGAVIVLAAAARVVAQR